MLSFFNFSCKKTALKPGEELIEQTSAKTDITAQFFHLHQSPDKIVKAIQQKILNQNERKPFVESFVKYAGFPIWDKAIVTQSSKMINSVGQRNEADAAARVIYIPLALENEQEVNSILKASISSTDTVFSMLYHWQYKQFGYTESDTRNSAHETALLFMGFEKHVFGHDRFKINDRLLFRKNDTSGKAEEITINSFNKPVENQLAEAVVITVCFTIIVNDPPPPSGEKFQSVIVPCHCHKEIYCKDYTSYVEVDEGGGGTAGGDTSGDGDGDGSGWEQDPCNTNPGGKVEPCGGTSGGGGELPGWEPLPDLPDVDRDANGYLYTRIAELQQILEDFPQALLPCDSLNIMPFETYGSMWQNVAQFKPSQYVMNRIDSIRNVAPNWIVDNFYIQSLEDAYGGIVNCDFFPVRITQIPAGFTPESLLEYFRTRINSFIDPNLGMSFGPYWDYGAGAGLFIDTAKYLAPYEASIGSLWHLVLGNLPGADGSVIESGYTRYNSGGYQTNYFTVSTMQTPLDFEHPVAGNRRFGIYSDPDHPGEYVFYTMGVDRAWDLIFDKGNSLFKGFRSADSLWKSLQNGMIQFIQNHNGNATFYSNHNTIARPHWSDVEEYLKGNIDFMELKRRLGC